MIVKFFLIIIIVSSSTFIGYLISNKYYSRKDFYNEFNLFIVELMQNVSFNQLTIVELIKQKDKNNDFYILFMDFLDNKKSKKPNYLLQNDIKILNNFFNSFGKNNSQNEIKLLESYKKLIESELKKASDEYDKNKNLYIKLGFLIGIMFSIVIL